jgi:hypothetical protein
MPRSEHRALSRSSKWLRGLPIPASDVERQILRVFALMLMRADSRTLRAHGKNIGSFSPSRYEANPLFAIGTHRALLTAGLVNASLSDLEAEYRSAPGVPEASGALFYDLLSIRTAHGKRLRIPATSALMITPRDQIIELCQLLTMASSCGVRRIDPGPGASALPQLAASYARDWDIETSCALLRACQYLRLSDSTACKWTIDWLLDQQQSDGRFGLLRAEASKCGWDPDDWRTYFEPTVHAIWALADIAGISGLTKLVRPRQQAKQRR